MVGRSASPLMAVNNSDRGLFVNNPAPAPTEEEDDGANFQTPHYNCLGFVDRDPRSVVS